MLARSGVDETHNWIDIVKLGFGEKCAAALTNDLES